MITSQVGGCPRNCRRRSTDWERFHPLLEMTSQAPKNIYNIYNCYFQSYIIYNILYNSYRLCIFVPKGLCEKCPCKSTENRPGCEVFSIFSIMYFYKQTGSEFWFVRECKVFII